MVIFHSYVSLPEGIGKDLEMPGFGKSLLLKKSLKVWTFNLLLLHIGAVNLLCILMLSLETCLRPSGRCMRGIFQFLLSFWTVSIQLQRSTKLRTFIHEHVKGAGIIPIGSMYAIYGKFTINIPPMSAYIYTIHGSVMGFISRQSRGWKASRTDTWTCRMPQSHSGPLSKPWV